MSANILNFEECIEKITYGKKIKKTDYLENGMFPIVSQEAGLINGYWNEENDIYKVTKPIIIFGDHTRVFKYIDFDFVLGSDGTKILMPKEFIDTKFFYYFLLANPIRSVGYSRHYRFIKKLKLIVPPLSTQHEIVKKLDVFFEEVNKVSNAIKGIIKNSESLFLSYLADIIEKSGDDWVESNLGNLTTKIGSGATPRGGNESYKKSGVSLIRSMNVYDKGFLYDKLAFIDDDQARGLENVNIQEEDILLNITGGSVARCCIVPSNVLPARVNQHVSILRAKKNIIYPELLHLILISPFHKRKLLDVGESGGATRQAITKTQIQDYVISFPKDLSAQEKLIKKISDIREETTKMKKTYELKMNSVNLFKHSSLQQIFNSSLVGG